ncbi:YadA-like family protein [Bartonella sp. AP58NXGY]|uniref:YadA-like family protein n=1 Tax=Bartonella sp. AP58NXGY TaxID=3243498 RepID=UPI0035D11524
MKKIYNTPKMLEESDIKDFCSSYRLPFIKTLSLVSVAVFLSNASPVSACDAWGNVSQYFGAGTNILKSIAPTYIINGKVYRDVGSALYGLERYTAEVAGNKLVKQDRSGLITIGANVGGNRISIENSSHELRTLTGVNSGWIAPFSSDAVNGSQLFSLGIATSSYFGGGAGFDKGKWTPPTFTVKVFDKDGNETEKHYYNVADAFTGVNSSFTNLDKKIENVVVNVAGNNLVKQDDTGLITIGGKVNGTRVSIANIDNAVRTLSGVNAGSITATSTDAINGSQAYAMSNVIASYFGGGAGYKDGNWSAPTFTVKVFDKDGNGAEKSYHNVADAFTGVNSSFTNLDKKIENIVINGTGDDLVKQDDTGLITIGGKVSGTRVSIANVNNAARILSGVKAGSITATSTDAINGSQAYAMSNVIASYFSGNAGYDADGNWNAPTFTVKVFDKNGNGAEKSYHNVADAFTGVNSSFTNLDKKIENIAINSAGNNLVKQNSAGLITIGGNEAGNRIDIANSINAPRIISGVKGGAFTATSTEAVNGGQLYFMAQAFASYFGGGAGYDDAGTWNDPTFIVKTFDKDGNETEKSYKNVADALTGVNSAFTNLNHRIIDIKNNPPIVEKPRIGKGGSDTITAGFPFMRRSRLIRSLPFVIDEAENAMDEEDNSTTVTVAPREILEKSTYEVTDNQFSQMSNRVTEVESKVNSVTNRVTEVENKVNVAVSYDTDDSGKKKNQISLHGVNDSDPVLIDNVGDGEVEKDSKQAVNGGQLHKYAEESHKYTDDQMKIVLNDANKYTADQVSKGVNEAKSYTDRKFEALSYDITNVRKEARQAAAIGLAVSNLRYFDDPGSLSVSFGGGLWRGQSAFAIGAGYTSEDGKIRSNLSATSAGGQWGVGGGITLKLK